MRWQLYVDPPKDGDFVLAGRVVSPEPGAADRQRVPPLKYDEVRRDVFEEFRRMVPVPPNFAPQIAIRKDGPVYEGYVLADEDLWEFQLSGKGFRTYRLGPDSIARARFYRLLDAEAKMAFGGH